MTQCAARARFFGDLDEGIETFKGPRGETLGDFVQPYTEDQVYKALALGAPHIRLAGMCRAPMAAATSAKKVGELIAEGNVPKEYAKFGSTIPEIFADLRELRSIYGDEADSFPTGAIGVFSYLNKIHLGVRQFLALNRKFDVAYTDRTDLIPLTYEALDLLNGTYLK